MKLHPTLSKLAQKLKNNYHTEMKHDNILAVSADKNELPFLFCIVEQSIPDTIILSFTLEPMAGFVASDITYVAMTTAPTALGEEFFIDDIGNIRWGEDAMQYFMLNAQLDVSTLTPPNELKN